jgi:hypothetical protein
LWQSSPERSIPNILAISTISPRSLPFVNCLGKLAIVSSLPGPQNLKDPKAKPSLSAFQALLQALFANEEASNDNNDEEDKDSPRSDDCDVNDDNNNLHGFLSMVRSLKD